MSKKEEEIKKAVESIKKLIFNDEVQSVLSNISNNLMEFNILEITGMGHHEIRHSNMLGWLFDDSEHNLEYEILDGFLKAIITENSEDSNSQPDILDKLQSYIYLAQYKKNITIYREKNNIDLLIVDESNKVVVTIENKIFATERTTGETDDGQLSKYEDIVNNKYPSKTDDEKNGYDKYFIFLTKNLDEPQKGKEYWMRASHQMVADVIKSIISKKEDLSIKTKLVLESYIDLLKRRGIVEVKELEELANKIWSNKDYKKALETLYEYKPDIQTTISKHLQDVLRGETTEEMKYISDYINFESSSKSFIRFSDKAFDNLEDQDKGQGWNSNISKILVYEFNNLADRLSLDLIIGPSKSEASDFREKLYNIKLDSKYYGKAKRFNKDKKSWPRMLKIPINIEHINELEEDEIKEKLNNFLLNFFKEEVGDFFKIQKKVIKSLELKSGGQTGA